MESERTFGCSGPGCPGCLRQLLRAKQRPVAVSAPPRDLTEAEIAKNLLAALGQPTGRRRVHLTKGGGGEPGTSILRSFDGLT